MRIWMTFGVLLLVAVGTVYAGTAGNLDDGFGTNGLVVSGFGGVYADDNNNDNDYDNDLAFGVASQADGKVVVVGGARFGNAGAGVPIDDDRFTVARYDLAGDLDTTFATTGWTTITLDGADEPGTAIAVALDADGKIVVVGQVTDLETRTITSGKGKNKTTTETTVRDGTRVAVVRLKTDGTLDATFGNDGVLLIGVAGCTDALARSVQVLSDGDILVGGGGCFATQSSGGGKKGRKSSGSVSVGAFLLRIDSDGGLDDTFGGGSVVTHMGYSSVAIHGLGIQATLGRIVALGLDGVVRGYDLDTGALDSSFGLSGVLVPPTDDRWNRLVVDDLDESILVCGQRRTIEILPNGETLFGGDGLVTRLAADGDDDDGGYVVSLAATSNFNAIGIDDQGRVVAGGNVAGDVFVLRLDADGSADTSFGPDGLGESTATSGTSESVLGLAVDGADVILVGTTMTDVSMDWLVARYCGTTDAAAN